VSEPPAADALTAPWWDATRERRLLLQACGGCGGVQHPPGAVCRACGAPPGGWIEAGGDGTIDTFTVVHRAPAGFTAPYVVARVRLAEGPIVLCGVVGCAPEAVACDLPVRLAWRPLGDGRNLPVFTLPEEPS